MITKESRFRGAMLGLACGDAVGTTNEFKARGSFIPVTDMVGGGFFRLKAGQWTDDTSMALCSAISLLQKRKFDARDHMERFTKWLEEGYMSSTGECFDIGGVVRRALSNYKITNKPWLGPFDDRSSGNGALMRLAPVILRFHGDKDAHVKVSAATAITHGSASCLSASHVFANVMFRAMAGMSKEDVLHPVQSTLIGDIKLMAIACGSYKNKRPLEIKGTGYVVDSLEAALWCFYNSDNYRDAILLAANLGDDADTTAAIAGQIAGAFYGVEGIPVEWQDRCHMGGYISEIGARLYRANKFAK